MEMKFFHGCSVYEDGTIVRPNGNVAKPYKNLGGILVVNLYYEGAQHTWGVHALLAKLFLDNPNGYKYVLHKDGNVLNNTLSNLEWSDRKKDNSVSIITEDGTVYLSIKSAMESTGLTYREITKKLKDGLWKKKN